MHLLWTEAQRSGGREKWYSVGHVPPLHYSSLPGGRGCEDVVPLVGTMEMRDGDREVPDEAAGQTERPMSPHSSASSLYVVLLPSTPEKLLSLKNGCGVQQSSCKPLTSLLFLGAKI